MRMEERITSPAYVVLDIPSPMAEWIRSVRSRFDEERSRLPAEITLTGSCGTGVISPGQSVREIAALLCAGPEQVEIRVKYEGYIKRQLADIEEARRLERKRLPQVDYAQIKGLRLEAVEKLNKVRPENIGQAGRISGVSPADISVLLIWLAAQERQQREGADQ